MASFMSCPSRNAWKSISASFALVLFSSIFFSQPLRAQAAATASAAVSVTPEQNARAVAKEWLARGIPGFAIAVSVDGKIVYSEGFGYADVEQRVPAWPTTKFRIASISKPLTAVALVQLIDAGKIDPDAPIQMYVPTFPDKGAVITPRLLAGHIAGIRHYKDDEFYMQKHFDSVTEGLKVFQDDPLVAPPGTKYSYSSYGFNLLSAAIEKASGEPFLTYMHDHVFVPMNMRDTLADQPAHIIEQRSRFYEMDKDHTLDNARYVDNSYKWAGGGFLSTVEDLARFGSALLQPGFLNSKSLQLLFTPQQTKDGKSTGYGMGFGIRKSKSGKRVFEHSGGAVGGTSQLIIYPDQHLVIAFINNLSSAPWKIEEVESIAEPFAK